MRSAARWLLVPLLVLGCDSASDAADKSKQAAQDAVDAGKDAVEAGKKAVKAGEDAVDASKKAIDSTHKAGSDAVDATKAAKQEAIDNLKGISADADKYFASDGELSDNAKAWLADASAKGAGTIEDVLAEGEQQAPAAIKVGTGLASAVDTDSNFEPIYVDIDNPEEADAKIGDMPKTQLVDGLTVGLQRVDAWEGLTNKKERGYLILWRQDDHLVGFVYRSRRDVDLAKVAEQVPTLVGLVRKSLAGSPED